MRLLRTTSYGEFSLTKDLVKDIPPYAILSHTWGSDDEEVTLHDLLDGTGKGKKGYRKILFCGEQAARDGLQHFWVDTCCIDKSNNVELTEAINSMFRWYGNAARCYVYLPNVPGSDSTQPEENSSEEARWEAFRKSRWFTRGWTLQELIAPSSVEFFSEAGERLGDRNSMDRRIAEITGVSIEALRGKPLSQFSVDERMAWARNRVTTREEDAAYSLLGIFEVFMPLIYGEGRQSALSRLRKEVDGEPRLPTASGASFDSYMEEHSATCLEDTRVELRRDIMAWADSDQGEHVFWLNGMAGTGKSTIARTVAQSLARRGQLGASFFFKKGEDERGQAGRLFTTIAADLTRRVPGVRQGVRRATEAEPNIPDRAMGEQFEKLILRPLSGIEQPLLKVSVVVVVIDALDECDKDEDARAIIQLLSRATEVRPVSLRVFVTSRPELPIRLGFRQLSGATYRGLALHDVPEEVIERDLAAFFRHELGRIGEERRLGADWPGDAKIIQLARMATPLFIFAATACRFIGDHRTNPRRRLETVIQNPPTGEVSRLDRIYLPILEQLFDVEDDDEREELAAEFREVVGSIVLLENPLPSNSLARLLGVASDDVNSRLYSLHSVLSIPGDDDVPIRLLHKSFRDFVLDPRKRGKSPFWVDERGTHERIATRCLQFLSGPQVLKRDMCNLGKPGILRKQISSQVVDECFPAEVRYACRHWVHHTRQGRIRVQDGHLIHQFLKAHFLHWLECLSLIGEVSEAIYMISSLQACLEDLSVELSSFLHDAKRFILRNRSIMDEAPLQIYASAMIFAPMNSVVRKWLEHDIPDWITQKPQVQADWDSSLQTLEGHGDIICAVVFSPDGKLVASASKYGTARLWDAATGACRATLAGYYGTSKGMAFSPDGKLVAASSEKNIVKLWDVNGTCQTSLKGHTEFVFSVTFSVDGTLLASTSFDRTVRLWDVTTGTCRATLSGHSREAYAATFSPDNRSIASASGDNTLRLWEVATGTCRAILTGHFKPVNDVAFSPDGKLVASASDDHSVRLWEAATGVCRVTLRGHSYHVQAVTFSPDGKLIASASDDKTVRLWETATEVCRAALYGHLKFVNAVAFSPDGTLVASASSDDTVRLWETATGTCRATLKGHSNMVRDVAFSPDGKLIASASWDHTVRLWDATAKTCQAAPEGHSDDVKTVVFSPDGSLIASASNDNTARLWETATGKCRATLTGHSRSVDDVTFSPDGKLVASISSDGAVMLWETTTGTRRATFNDNLDSNGSLSFSPDGSYLNSDMGRIRIGYTPLPSSKQKFSPRFQNTHWVQAWIYDDEKNRMLWLPIEFRPCVKAIRENVVVIGCSSGSVIILSFSPL
ncbi:vegetative incompatibility protein HET-E-1 [Phaeosphaeriaceae sp. PMI808]|nr:vegetative incompatibility protein HET-E-1 [Phaeosphaeriaceae sp. PMI808]